LGVGIWPVSGTCPAFDFAGCWPVCRYLWL
jgi:hypothetical protein